MQIDTKTGRLDLEVTDKGLEIMATEWMGRATYAVGVKLNRRQASRMAHALAVYSQTGTVPENPQPLKEWSVV